MLPTMASTGSRSDSAPQTRKRIPKVEGDISSVFASLAGDKKGELPIRFADLKGEIIGQYGDAILASWKRLLPVVEAKVREANERGPSIFPEVQFSDIQNGKVDSTMIERIKRTGVCIVRNAVPKEEAAEILSDVRKYIKANPTTKGTGYLQLITNDRLSSRRSTDLGTLLVAKSTSRTFAS